MFRVLVRLSLAGLMLVCGIPAAHAAPVDLSASFPTGSGSRFMFVQEQGARVELVISVAQSQASEVDIEYFFRAVDSLIPIEMWQQYRLERASSGALSLKDGYVLAKELSGPERMPSEFLKGFDGVAMGDFLFADAAALAKIRVGEESVTVPAGQVTATHYARENRGQKVDFWISDEAKPLGLVKLVSKGSKSTQNYVIELESVVRNVGRKIDPKTARPLSDAGRKLLSAPVH